jgi:HAD superfamily hydrolase (TIGR01549 family)
MYTAFAMTLDGVIFDLDGTLGDTLPVCFVAFRRAMQGFSNRRYTDEEIRALFGPSEEGIIRRIVPNRWQACLQAYLTAYEEESARTARLFPGIETALRLLRGRGHRLAIVTGKGAASAAISLRDLRLAEYFDVVETGSPEGGVKPQAIKRILLRWGAPPHRVAYVGDAPADMQAAREAGVIPLGAAWAATACADELRAASPLETFRSVEHFIAWIEAHVEPRRS